MKFILEVRILLFGSPKLHPVIKKRNKTKKHNKTKQKIKLDPSICLAFSSKKNALYLLVMHS